MTEPVRPQSSDDEDWGWYCPIHGYQLDGSPDLCIEDEPTCLRFEQISQEQHDRVKTGRVTSAFLTMEGDDRAAIEALLKTRDILDAQIEMIRSQGLPQVR